MPDTIQLSKDEIYQHGVSPVIQDLADESQRPISEITAIHNQTTDEVEAEQLNDPESIPVDMEGNSLIDDRIWDMTRAKILTPEEGEWEEDDIDSIMGNMDAMFKPQEPREIDPYQVGFTQEDMDLTNQVADAAAQDYFTPESDGFDFGEPSEQSTTDHFDEVRNMDSGDVNAVSEPVDESLKSEEEKAPAEAGA